MIVLFEKQLGRPPGMEKIKENEKDSGASVNRAHSLFTLYTTTLRDMHTDLSWLFSMNGRGNALQRLRKGISMNTFDS